MRKTKQPYHVIEYIDDICKELCAMAAVNGFTALSLILELAVCEVATERTRQRAKK